MTLRMWLLLIGLGVAGLCAVDAAKAQPAQAKKAAAAVKKSKKVSSKKLAKKTSSVKKTAKSAVTPQAPAKGELQTDVKFDDSVLHGQYQTPEEALARVENEKGLSDLIGVRKHFKDRLATASGQE